MARGLSCSATCEIFLAQRSDPCLRHRQADASPLSHPGGPVSTCEFFFFFLTAPQQFVQQTLMGIHHAQDPGPETKGSEKPSVARGGGRSQRGTAQAPPPGPVPRTVRQQIGTRGADSLGRWLRDPHVGVSEGGGVGEGCSWLVSSPTSSHSWSPT